MHASSTQTASTTGEFGHSEGIAPCNSDMAMHRELPV